MFLKLYIFEYCDAMYRYNFIYLSHQPMNIVNIVNPILEILEMKK